MANEEQLSILKQGVEAWNKWREENPAEAVDLTGADLKNAVLPKVNLLAPDQSVIVNLWTADFRRANLQESDLRGANLFAANFEEADLRGVAFSGAILRSARFRGADLRQAVLRDTDLTHTFFSDADLSEADISLAECRGTRFDNLKMFKTKIGNSCFVSTDLSEIVGLEEVLHYGPSSISVDTINNSKGKIPEVFLRGCGLSDSDIEYAKLANPDLNNDEINKVLYKVYDLRARNAIQISPLFISYSHGDGQFVDKMEESLNRKGIRYWRDIHDMKSGRMEQQIDRAMRLNPTVLLILSEHSLKSDWVEHEVRMARSLEKEMGRDVLCPVALDDSWKNSPWSKRVMEQVMEYNILDFSEWKDDGKFENIFNKLIDGLGLFYK